MNLVKIPGWHTFYIDLESPFSLVEEKEGAMITKLIIKGVIYQGNSLHYRKEIWIPRSCHGKANQLFQNYKNVKNFNEKITSILSE